VNLLRGEHVKCCSGLETNGTNAFVVEIEFDPRADEDPLGVSSGRSRASNFSCSAEPGGRIVAARNAGGYQQCHDGEQ
jgi:hypothetical protein